MRKIQLGVDTEQSRNQSFQQRAGLEETEKKKDLNLRLQGSNGPSFIQQLLALHTHLAGPGTENRDVNKVLTTALRWPVVCACVRWGSGGQVSKLQQL